MDRPVKFNPSGKYNLDFIDYTNDLCVQHPPDDPLYELINKYFQQVTYESESEYVPCGRVDKDNISKLPTTKSQISQECLICLQKFVKGDLLRQLPCKHCFHQLCMEPWFSSNTKCPNCRFDVGSFFSQS